jgi:hypothetical protein
MRDSEARELADRLDEEADGLERRSELLEQHTKDVANEWAHRSSDPKVPGAPPEDDDEDSDYDYDDDDEHGEGWDDPDEEEDDDADYE